MPDPSPSPQSAPSSGSDCDLKSARGDIKHVIYIEFDNVHFTRDNPNVPSDQWALPDGVEDSGDEFAELARAYKRINAPVGELGLASLKVSTKALAGDDETYRNLENQLSFITSLRNHLADEMLEKLTAAEFHGRRIGQREGHELVRRSEALMDYVNWLASQ